MKILSLLLFVALLAGCDASATRKKQVQPGANNRQTRDGIPELHTIDEAVAYVLKEDSVVNYRGIVCGSEEFQVLLPSGRQISNWYVDCLFRRVFAPFGKEAIPSLIKMLGHDYQHARLGAYEALMQITGRYDERCRLFVAPEQRQAGIRAWEDWWIKNEHNSRLDSRPNRVYEAANWESQTIR